MKRAFDIFLSAIGLLIFLPIFAVITVLIKIGGRGPVFFVQTRIGRNFKSFGLYKFRTMAVDAPEKGRPITVKGDLRVTKVGRFLRKTKINELPQLWNVLKGDMSLIGPRPEVRRYISKYRKDYKEILKIRPGITDIALLTYSNEEAILKDKKDPEEYYIHILLPEKIKLAREYIKKASLLYDLKLIFLTTFKLVYPQDTILKIINIIMPYRGPIIIGVQLSIFIISNYLAFFIRFDGNVSPPYFDLFLKYLPLLLLLRFIFLFVFSLDRGLWRYVSVIDLLNIIAAASLGSLLFFVSVRYLFGETSYPRSIYLIDWFLNIFLLGGIRLFRRLHERANGKQGDKKRVIVIGAGKAAEMLLRDVEQSSSYPYSIIGLIDDDPRKKGLKIRNISILGARKDLRKIIEKNEPEEFLIAIPSASPSEIQSIIKDLRQFGLPIKTLPSLWNILSGRDPLSKIKLVEPEDVLFRPPVYKESGDLRAFFEGKRVMVTGPGGSIGSEISRQIASFNPEYLILFERHEESLYKIDMELNNSQESGVKSQGSKIHSIIGDILDEKRVAELMERFRPQVVFHAAAYKHVPLMEENPYEAFKTNVIGTKIVVEKARDFGVERFVLISTDKAVNPVNVMGKTKKIAEDIVRYYSEDMNSISTKYITVRFGNVLESSGSVVPLFKEQIKKGGPVTVTHLDITRYFMTIPEAVSLVLQAATMGNGGEVFVLDMGEPVRILDLAKRMISLYGYRPGVDIDINFIELRPGEKLYEELFNSYETIEKTPHPKINKAISNGIVNQNILEILEPFNNPESFRNSADIKNILNELTQQHSR
jgi:FlaA1/EpsC-like NDP-sugar epimerase/lipopolysaccharide/colanic/teichoic acid biosynthesis glycosyltransferase